MMMIRMWGVFPPETDSIVKLVLRYYNWNDNTLDFCQCCQCYRTVIIAINTANAY